jgi:hypothetical protein
LQCLGGGLCTESQFDKLADFIQDWVNHKLVDGHHEKENGAIRNHPTFSSLLDKISKSKATLAHQNEDDLHAELFITVCPDQEIAFVNECYSPTKSNIVNMSHLARQQVATTHWIAFQTAERSQNVRALTYKMSLLASWSHWAQV